LKFFNYYKAVLQTGKLQAELHRRKNNKL